MMPLSRLGCPLSLKTAHMGNPGRTGVFHHQHNHTTPCHTACASHAIIAAITNSSSRAQRPGPAHHERQKQRKENAKA